MADDRFYVKSLTLENFRCFGKAELGPFDPQFNLLVAENGAGKSSVLAALADLFAGMGGDGSRPIPLMGGTSDIRRYEDYDDVLIRKVPFQATLRAKYFPAASRFAMMFRNEMDADVTFSESPDAALFANRTSASFVVLSQHERLGEGTALPLISFYRSNRRFPAENRQDSVSEKLSSPRYAGLRGWTNAGLESYALTEWLRDETLAKYQGDARYYLQRGDNTDPVSGYFLDLVTGAIAAGVEGARHIEYGGRVGEIVLTYTDGRKQRLSEMSDGQRAIVCLFADLARRMCILNGGSLQERALTETSGLVLIDEIDLHLHPKWQRQIVPALKKIFPKIQFFATTHSPQVIGECKPEEIVLLTPHGQKRPSGGYGRDSNWILECVMNAEGRDPDIAVRLRNLFELIEDEKFDEARDGIKLLRRDIGYGPEIVEAEAYLWRMEHLGEEAAE